MEFVYSVNEGIVRWGNNSSVTMHLNDIWFAADPFVAGRPDLFSATPLIVHSTEGRPAPAATPVGVVKPEPVRGRKPARV